MIAWLPALLAGVAAALASGRGASLVDRRLGHLARPVRGASPRVGGMRRVAEAARRRARRRSMQRGRSDDVVEGCLSLAAELRAGAPPTQALAVAAGEWPGLFGPAAGRASIGGDPVAALRETATSPGAGALRAVATAWEVSERTGAGLSTVLVAVADTMRSEAVVRREGAAALATVKATARLLALLPVGTLLLFSAGEGGAPVRFLLGDPYGICCLVVAGLLVGAGLMWVERMSRRALRSAWPE
ncbi:MAG TPA: type II secretion system F family protein [Jiangellaceae bacterium]